MKKYLILLLLALIASCKVHNQDQSYANRIRLLDSIVSVNRDIDTLQSLLSEYEASHDDAGKMVVMGELGRICRESSDFKTALGYHEKALSLAKKLKDTANIIYILNQLGTDFRRLGVLDEAAGRHYEALSYCENYSDQSSSRAIKSRVVTLNGIGNIHLSLKNYDAAEDIFRKALAEEINLGSHLGQAINYANIGYVKEVNGDRDSAWIYYNLSMEQNRLADSKLGISLCYNHFGELAEQDGDWDKALESYKNSYNLMHEDKDRWHWLESCLSIARIYLVMGESNNAHSYLEEGLKTASEIRSWDHLAEAYRLKSLYEESKGQYKASLESFRKHSDYTDSVSNEKSINRLNNLRTSYIVEKGNKEKEYINRAYANEQQKKRIVFYFLIIVILVSAAAISALLYALRVKAKMQNIIRKDGIARQEFFTNVTHEFRTPLTVILGCVEELKSEIRIKESETSLDAISRQSRRLLTLVNQLLDIAKVRSAIGNADWKNGNITVFIQMVIENVRPYAVRKFVDIEYQADRKETEMDFVPDYMYKILTNLIFNALKYTPKGGSITVRSNVVDNNIRICIEDTGFGIKPEDLPHIFEPFFQSNTHSVAGTGIGLALTKQMTEAMGGNIDVSSREGEGTSFILCIPIRNGESRFEKWISDYGIKENAIEDPELDETDGIVYQEDNISKDMDIALVVEDNEDIARYIGNIIKDSFSVIYARNGREGLVKAEEYVPDIIITDIMMPEYDGLEMTRDIRKSDLLNHIPIIIVTAKSDEAHKMQGLDCGVDAYLIKPFSPEELKLRIHKLVEYRSMLRDKYSQIMIDGEEISEEPEAPTLEKCFLMKLNNLIATNISLPNLNSEMLAENICLSKSQLNRKVKSITGMSTAAYIKQSRLIHAQILLRDPQKTIGEIVLLCGFESASYFTKLFKEKFGMTPSEFRKEKY